MDGLTDGCIDGWMDGLVNDHAGKERERKGVK